MGRAALRFLVALVVATAVVTASAVGMALWADLASPPEPPEVAEVRESVPIVTPKRVKPKRQRKAKPKRRQEAPRPAAPALSLPSAIAVPVFEGEVDGPAAVVHPTEARADVGAVSATTVLTEEMADVAPRPLFKAPLRYPKAAEARGVEGEVEARLLLDSDGSVLQIQVVSATPEGVFESAARESLSRWRFTPATFRGQQLRAWVRQRVVFALY